MGGLFVFRSFANAVGDCKPGKGADGKGTYLFSQCYKSDNKPLSVQDQCVIQYAVSPGRLKNRKDLQYEKVAKDAVAQVAKLSGTKWYYTGETSYHRDNLPENRKHIVLIQFDVFDGGVVPSDRSGNRVAAGAFPVQKVVTTPYRGGTIVLNTAFMESRLPAGQASSDAKGKFTSAQDFRNRTYNTLQHELGHIYGLEDLYKNGNSQKIVDVTQKMGSHLKPWGSGDKAGLKQAAYIANDLSKCWTPPNIGQTIPPKTGAISDASAKATVEAAYATVLGRKPDASGARYWENSLKLGRVTKTGLPTRLLKSAEGKKLFTGATTLNQQVSQMYKNALCRTASAAEVAQWTNSNGATFNSVSLDLGSSSAAKTKRVSVAEGKKICR